MTTRSEMIARHLAPGRPLSEDASAVADALLEALDAAEGLPPGDRLQLLCQAQAQIAGAIARAAEELTA